MKNFNKVDSELESFFTLGIFVFLSLTILFSLKITPQYLAEKNQLPFTFDIYNKNSFKNLNIDRIPELIIVNDNKTPYNFNDDIVSYNTSFYSLLLPYNLDYYTSKFGANNSSKQLLSALKQVYSQIHQNGLLENDYEKRQFKNLISYWTYIIRIEDNAINVVSFAKKNVNKKKINYCSNIELISTKNNNYFLKIKRTEQEIINSLNYKDAYTAEEGITIIVIINNHLTALAENSYIDYNYHILNKGYNYSEVNKVPIYNIIERLENSLRNTNANK